MIKVNFCNNRIVGNIKYIISTTLLLVFGTGFVATYDWATLHNDSWTKSTNVLHYSWNMFLVIVFGAAIHALFLFFVFLTISAFVMACYYVWFVMLPLFLMFLVICIGRWYYLKRHLKMGNSESTSLSI